MVRVVFLHPDLGIGGAERLVVDAAMALKSRGHDVTFVTSHHDPSHCFPETREQLPVVVAGDFLPRQIAGRFYAVCAYLRMIYAAFHLVLVSGLRPDVVVCDQISAAIPVLKWTRAAAKIVFYCHFPDQLLTQRETTMKRLYRAPIDWLEEKTTAMADVCLVNSRFTADIFARTFKSIRIEPRVLNPSLNTDKFDEWLATQEEQIQPSQRVEFLSINRYERKKNLPLAIKAFAHLAERRPDASVHLTLIGGYDRRVAENVSHHTELEQLAADLDVSQMVTFGLSPSDEDKMSLLRSSSALLYTPSGEHFGIVPVEAMYSGLPVIAVDDGAGPTETVRDGQTGFLRPATVEAFAAAMEEIVDGGDELKARMGAAGRDRVRQHFSFEAFGEALHHIVTAPHT